MRRLDGEDCKDFLASIHDLGQQQGNAVHLLSNLTPHQLFLVSDFNPKCRVKVKAAVFDTPTDRAPGPDGFSAGFFHTSLEVSIKEDLMLAVNKFHSLDEHAFGSMKTAHYVLLPKVDQPTHCGNYRPISLIHAFAKLV
jgi:hypothetical protein